MRADLRDQVLAIARTQPSPPRSVRKRSDALIVALSVFATVALFIAWGGVVSERRSWLGLVVLASGWALLALVATLGSLSRAGSMLGRPTRALAVIAWVAAPAIYSWASGCTATLDSFGDPAPWNANIGCWLATLSLSAVPFVAFGVLRRGSDPVHPRALGAALGASAGAWGGVLIDLHCPVTHWLHVGFAHITPIVAFAALGAAFGKRTFGVRS